MSVLESPPSSPDVSTSLWCQGGRWRFAHSGGTDT